MIEIKKPVERATLVACPQKRTRDDLNAREHLDELGRLADTAGAEVIDRVTQRLGRISPRLLMGEGKAKELAARVAEREASLVIFDDLLSPAQGKNLEAALGVRVMDRTELILDIFATRARTTEAKLQVELAQLEYLLPRLARMWSHLSRIRGGIGLRGPGETQLETDRRMIRQRIARLRRKLEDVARHRSTIRQGQDRRGIATAALVGYTNAGKSSLLRALSKKETFVEDRLFATLDTLSREIFVAGHRLRLVDTVGFIRKLPHHLVASFRATLDEAQRAEVLLHVIDAAHPDWEEQVGVVNEALADLGIDERTVVHVFNKIDLVDDPAEHAERVAARFNGVCVSAAQRDLGALEARLGEVLGRPRAMRAAR